MRGLKLCLPFPRSSTSITRYHCFSHYPLSSVVCREYIRTYLPNTFSIQGRADLDFHLPGKYPYLCSRSNPSSSFAGLILTSLEFTKLSAFKKGRGLNMNIPEYPVLKADGLTA